MKAQSSELQASDMLNVTCVIVHEGWYVNESLVASLEFCKTVFFFYISQCGVQKVPSQITKIKSSISHYERSGSIVKFIFFCIAQCTKNYQISMQWMFFVDTTMFHM